MWPSPSLKAHRFTAASTLQTDVKGYFLKTNFKDLFLLDRQNLLQESVARKKTWWEEALVWIKLQLEICSLKLHPAFL